MATRTISEISCLPVVIADDGEARDLVAVALQETHLFPARLPVRPLHIGQIGEQSNWLLAVADRRFDLLGNTGNVIAGEPSDNL
jgi:hypothetical protein